MTINIESLQFDPYDTQVNLRAMMASVSTQHKGLNDATNIDLDVDGKDNDDDDGANGDDDDEYDVDGGGGGNHHVTWLSISGPATL